MAISETLYYLKDLIWYNLLKKKKQKEILKKFISKNIPYLRLQTPLYQNQLN